jgi:hypothetical protein
MHFVDDIKTSTILVRAVSRHEAIAFPVQSDTRLQSEQNVQR